MNAIKKKYYIQVGLLIIGFMSLASCSSYYKLVKEINSFNKGKSQVFEHGIYVFYFGENIVEKIVKKQKYTIGLRRNIYSEVNGIIDKESYTIYYDDSIKIFLYMTDSLKKWQVIDLYWLDTNYLKQYSLPRKIAKKLKCNTDTLDFSKYKYMPSKIKVNIVWQEKQYDSLEKQYILKDTTWYSIKQFYKKKQYVGFFAEIENPFIRVLAWIGCILFFPITLIVFLSLIWSLHGSV